MQVTCQIEHVCLEVCLCYQLHHDLCICVDKTSCHCICLLPLNGIMANLKIAVKAGSVTCCCMSWLQCLQHVSPYHLLVWHGSLNPRCVVLHDEWQQGCLNVPGDRITLIRAAG